MNKQVRLVTIFDSQPTALRIIYDQATLPWKELTQKTVRNIASHARLTLATPSQEQKNKSILQYRYED